MKKVLIATHNLDKLDIVTKLLATSILKESHFYSLRDIEDITDKKEVGDVTNRAKEKALNVYENMKHNDFDYIIGIDDVIKIKDKIYENIKEYLKPILFEQYLEENEIISIVRAFTFIDQRGHVENVITEIPYEYHALKNSLELKENSYPLSYVMAGVDTKKTVAMMTKDEGNTYYLKYSKEPLENLIKKFDKEEAISK